MTKAARFPSLDGWRAVSIFIVLGHHCSCSCGFPKSLDSLFRWLFDGILGVRFFFIISGFLITHLLFQEFSQTGRIRLRQFYIRRALRILPAYFAYLSVVFLLQFVTSWRQEPATWIGNLTFTTNYFKGYWETGHLWSLAVEEQFYLLWPFVLILVGLSGAGRKFFYILGIPLLVAPVCRVISYLKPSEAGFSLLIQKYSFLCNFDSLAAGCIAAILLAKNRPQISLVLNKFKLESVLLALVLIVIPLVLRGLFLAGIFTVPFGNTFQAAGFAILMLQSILSPQLFKPLNWPVVRNIGVLSYSIYIWQEIFCSNPADFGLSNAWFMSFPVWLLPAFLVAILSYYGLEKPFFGLRAYFRNEDSLPGPACPATSPGSYGE